MGVWLGTLSRLHIQAADPPDYSPEATALGVARGKVMDRQGLYKWTDEEWLDLAIFSEANDLPVGLMVALRKAENGAPDYAYGQISVSSEIKALYDPEFWQMAQACRTARRILLDYTVHRHYLWGSFCVERPADKRIKEFLKMYRRDFLQFAAKRWAHPNDKEQWARNVRLLWNQWDKEHP